MRNIQAAARIVGRRTTLRYLAIGVGASFLAACKGGGENGGTDDGSPTSSPTGKAFAAFMRGTWQVESTSPNGDKATGTGSVDDGAWSLTYSGQDPWHGTWSLQGSRPE